MKVFLGIVITLFAGLHAFAAITHAKNSTDKRNDRTMTLGAMIAIISGNCVQLMLLLIGY
ncbi:MAG: hypothetical protein IKB01_04900 [Lachnospiraceae bacterium]|nr:hypothetical protein [Lachnospiraceae bacterium]